jgi:hypothetical protein
MQATFAVKLTPAHIDGVLCMRAYSFDVFLDQLSEVTDEHADALFAAGCDDATPISRDGMAWVHFDRESASLEEAIRSAVKQVQSAGLAVAKVEIDADAAVALGV